MKINNKKASLQILFWVFLLVVCTQSTIFASASIYEGILLSRPNLYDYAPSAMYGDGNNIRMWWGSNNNGHDGIYHSYFTSSGWATPQLVMQSSSSGWDSYHTCDPSVIKGSFSYNNTNYQYAMYYTGTYDPAGRDSHIGVAFSNDGLSWVRYSGPVVGPQGNAAGSYGAGMQTVYRDSSGLITMVYYDSTTGGSPYCMATSSDGKNFSSPTILTNPSPSLYTEIGDIAYSPSEGKWWISTKHNDQEIFIYKTANSSLTSTWNYCGLIDKNLTGNTANHNPGWLRYPNGDIYIESNTLYKYICFGTGVWAANNGAADTWDIGWAKIVEGWEFSINGNKEEWNAYNVSTDYGPSGGYWCITADKNDPQFLSPNFELPATQFSKVQFHISNQNAQTDGKVYFKTAAEPYFDESKAVTFTCYNNVGSYVYSINMATNPKWTGTITGIRIDPIGAGNNKPLGIDYVRFAQ